MTNDVTREEFETAIRALCEFTAPTVADAASNASYVLYKAATARPKAETGAPQDGNCPRCGSPDAKRHPAVQHGGEVEICPHPFHGPESQDLAQDAQAVAAVEVLLRQNRAKTPGQLAEQIVQLLRPSSPPREAPESVRHRAVEALRSNTKYVPDWAHGAVDALADAGLLASHEPGPLVVTMEECEEMATLLGDALHVGMILDGEAISRENSSGLAGIG
jgi:hypothetical protein